MLNSENESKKLGFGNLFLMIFYLLLSTSAVLDTYLSIKFQIETENLLILCLIFLILFPISLLIQSLFIFFELKENSGYEYQKINEKIEIINADKIFELDFRYLDEDINRGLFIIIVSSVLSYTKLILFHIFINAYRNGTRFGYFSSLKYILIKIIAMQIIFQSIPFFIRKFIFDIELLDHNNQVISYDRFLNEFYYLNFVALLALFLVYSFFYKVYFSKLQKEFLRVDKIEIENSKTDYDNMSAMSLNYKENANESFRKSTFTINNSFLRNNNSGSKGKYKNNESVDIRNSF